MGASVSDWGMLGARDEPATRHNVDIASGATLRVRVGVFEGVTPFLAWKLDQGV